MPAHHDVQPANVVNRRLAGSLRAAANAAPADFESLLLTAGVGPRTLASLAMVSEVIHGGPSRFSDPARFSMAHGGKDGHPFPVPLTIYDETIRVLRAAVQAAKLGNETKMAAIRRLDVQARLLEQSAEVDVAAFVHAERRASFRYGGMTVLGPARRPSRAATEGKRSRRERQLALPGIG